MKIFVSSQLFPDRPVVSDEEPSECPDISEPLQLVFVDGKVTIPVFKSLYLAGTDAYFVVKNLECFIHRMRLFRNMQFHVEAPPVTKEEISDKLNGMIEKYISVEKKLGKKDASRGVEVSFRPKLVEAVRSSFEQAGLYKCEETRAHKIFRVLKDGKMKLTEIEEVAGPGAEQTLKSLMHFGVVVRKGDHFVLSESIFCPK